MPNKTSFVIGTRKSELALVQTYHVRDMLQAKYPQYTFTIKGMTTMGDEILNKALSKIGEKALFTKELEVALEKGSVDLVVHCLKDLPTVLPPGMLLGAIMEREDPRDALVLSKKCQGYTLQTLPAGSVIGTSSLRRVAQLKRHYPHLKFIDVRGNLNTRIAKLDDENELYQGIILAVAGLVRLGKKDRISQILSPEDSLYAVSQGALGIECRANDNDTIALLEALNHDETRLVCLAERSLMRTLEGGCSVPIGVNTKLEGKKLKLHGLVSNLDGQEMVKFEDEISVDADTRDKREALAEQLGLSVANTLLKRGADKILKELGHSLNK
ncbi:porphobilinogen deaminase [Pilobolus umbonatus]|nr:porphobilinogen deaminase [Pilobolus umbonatus]